MSRSKVWRKSSTRYVDAKTGKRTSKDDPQAVKRVEYSKRFYGTLTASDGSKKQKPLTEDKTTSLALLLRLQNEADKDRALGIVPQERKADKPIQIYIDKYKEVLASRNGNKHYQKTTLDYISDVLADAKASTPRTIEVNAVMLVVNQYRTKGKYNGGRRRKVKPALETCNHYLRAVKAFSKWLWTTDILNTDPLKNVTFFNSDTARKKIRRAMTIEELAILYTSTLTAKTYGGKRWRFNGEDRALLYIVAASTGLRASELASLRCSSFAFEGARAKVKIQAKSTKNKKFALCPLPQYITEKLSKYLSTKKPNEFVWPGSWAEERKGGVLFKRDAKNAGLTILDEDGESIDFHALRTSFITSLARSGVFPAVAQRLARHSTITLTMNTYTKLDDEDLREAVEQLPSPFEL